MEPEQKSNQQTSKLHQELQHDHRKVYDAVYGFISFPRLIWKFVDTQHFQRLRNIKQLGCLAWVFPGAMHSRFQHSLGTGYLAQKFLTTMIKKIEKYENDDDYKSNQQDVIKQYNGYVKVNEEPKYVSIKQEAIFVITLAGLLHDIGHGPYSHLFDNQVVKKIQIEDKQKKQTIKIKWTHELASLKIIEHLFKKVCSDLVKENSKKKDNINKIKWLNERVLPRVLALIMGQKKQPKDGQKSGFQEYECHFTNQIKTREWEFQLISNRITGIDVDKLDYFRRDAYYVGAKNIYIDHQLLMNQALVLRDNSGKPNEEYRICFPSKYAEKVYDVFFSRYKLYKTYYLNHKSNGVDCMIADIMINAQESLQMIKACEDLYTGGSLAYLKFTDQILETIENTYYKQSSEKQLEDSKLNISYNLIQKLKNRQIYDFLEQFHCSYDNNTDYKEKKKIVEDKVIKELSNLKGFEFKCKITDISFGIKEENPFNRICFFEKSLPQKKIIGKQDDQFHFSMLKPTNHIELSLRIYYKQRRTQLQDSKIKQIWDQLEKSRSELKKNKMYSGNSGTFFEGDPSKFANLQNVGEMIKNKIGEKHNALLQEEN